MGAEAGFQGSMSETLGAVTSGATDGTSLTASASTNVKGNWVTLGTPNFDYEAVYVSFENSSAAADYVVDIGAYDGANVHVRISDLRVSSRKATASFSTGYYLPLRFKSGIEIQARVAASSGAAIIRATITGFQKGLLGQVGCGMCSALYTPSTSMGVTIDPGGTANTKGSWTQLIASVPQDINYLILHIGPNADVGRGVNASALLDIGVGSSGNEYVILGDMHLNWNTGQDTPSPQVIQCVPIMVKSGVRLAARMQCSDNTAGDRTIDLSAWGVGC